MVRTTHVIISSVAAITTFIFLHVNGVLDGSLVDGILMTAIFVTVVSALAGMAAWIITSIIITKNKSQTITTSNFLAGALSGYIMASVVSGWYGPVYGMILGIIAGTSCCVAFKIKNRRSLDDTSWINVIMRGAIWYVTVNIPFTLWLTQAIISLFQS